MKKKNLLLVTLSLLFLLFSCKKENEWDIYKAPITSVIRNNLADSLIIGLITRAEDYPQYIYYEKGREYIHWNEINVNKTEIIRKDTIPTVTIYTSKEYRVGSVLPYQKYKLILPPKTKIIKVWDSFLDSILSNAKKEKQELETQKIIKNINKK